MKLDNVGKPRFTVDEIAEELYRNPSLDLDLLEFDGWDDIRVFNNAVTELYLEDTAKLRAADPLISSWRFDSEQQSKWFMPDSYINYDIETWLFLQCANEPERKRVVEELEQYQARELYPLLRYMKYLVDTMRKHKVVWGVGRGSSVASYVLYKIGIHKIDSLKYNLDWREFLR